MKIDFNKIDNVISAQVESDKYNNCYLNEIEFDETSKKFIEDIKLDYQHAIETKKINLFLNTTENDEYFKKILEKFPDKNNKFYADIFSCIGNIYNSIELINDVFKLKVCKNININ